MNKVTPEEIAILKRIAAIENITHKVEKHWKSETDQQEDYDCFYAKHRSVSFEWCAKFESFDDFIKDYAEYKYDCGYQTAGAQ